MALNLGELVAYLKVDDSSFRSTLSSAPSLANAAGAKMGSELGSSATGGFGKNFALAGVLAGVTSAATTFVMGQFGQIASAAVTASDATSKFKQTLDFAGFDTSAIDAATAATQNYADVTVYDLATIQNTTAQLAANGIKDYTGLTEAAGNLNAVAGGNAETFKSVGMVLTQTAGAGKLTTENWNQLANAIPGASGMLQEALLKNGAFTGNFRDAMAQGQITSEEFNAALMELGSEPVAVEAAKSTSTFEGAIGNLQANVVGTLTKMLDDMKPMLTDAIGFISDFFSQAADTVTGFFTWFSDNSSWLIPVIAGIGTAILLTAGYIQYLGIAAAIAAAGGLPAIIAATWAWTAALLANPVTWIILGIAALIAVIVALAMNWDSVTTWISETWNGFVTWISESLSGLASWWNETWSAISQFAQDVWNTLVSWFNTAIQVLIDLFLNWTLLGIIIKNWDAISKAFTNAWNAISKWFSGAISAFQSGWNSAWSAIGSFFTTIWNGMWTGIQSWWTTVSNWFVSLPKVLGDFFVGAGKWLYDSGRAIIEGLWNGISSLASKIGEWFLDLLPSWIVEPFKHALGIKSPSKVFHEFGQQTVQGYLNGITSMKGSIGNILSKTVTAPSVSSAVVGMANGGAIAGTKVINYYAAENQSLSAEEALFAALSSPRVRVA